MAVTVKKTDPPDIQEELNFLDTHGGYTGC